MTRHGKVVGRAFRIDLPEDTFSEAKNGEIIVTRTYRTHKLSWLQESPARGAAHPQFTLAKLETKSAKQATPGYLVDVTLTYRQPGQEEDTTPEPGAVLPIDRYCEIVTEGTANIEEHPNFTSFATVANGAIFSEQGKFTGWQSWSPFVGRLTYFSGSVTRSITSYSWGRPSSVAGLIGTKSGNWLVRSGSVQREGIYWSRTINEQYNPNGWPSPIYT